MRNNPLLGGEPVIVALLIYRRVSFVAFGFCWICRLGYVEQYEIRISIFSISKLRSLQSLIDPLTDGYTLGGESPS